MRRSGWGQVGWFRRNHLATVPDVPPVQNLNAMIDHWDEHDGSRRIGGRTVEEFLKLERPLPEEPFETGRWFTP